MTKVDGAIVALLKTRLSTSKCYCLQDVNELAWLAERVKVLHPARVVEIEALEGGWLWAMEPFFAPGALLIAIEPGLKNIFRPDRLEATAIRLRAEGHPFFEVNRISQNPLAVQDVRVILNGQMIDLLHIDGAHDYNSVKTDYEMYAPLVRKGGLIVFHDVNSRHAAEKVYQLWDELKADKSLKTSEVGYRKDSVGIGMVEV